VPLLITAVTSKIAYVPSPGILDSTCICPLTVVFVESSQLKKYEPQSIATPAVTSLSDIATAVTLVRVPLLNLKFPLPGSAIVVVVLKL
jgi:cation transporter-like permease